MIGKCKHGGFDLEKGCPQCVAEKEGTGVASPTIASTTGDVIYPADQPEPPAAGPMVFIDKGYPPSPGPDTHASIQVNPELAPFYNQLRDEVVDIERCAGKLQVTNPEEVRTATLDLALIANLTKAIEERRKEYVGPLNDYVKLFNDAFRKLSEPLKGAETATKQKILAYQRAMEEARKKAEEDIANARAEATRKAEEIKRKTGEIVEILPEQVDLPPEATTKVRTDLGTASQTDNWKYDIVDRTLIPAEYWVLDEVKLGKVVRAGIRTIPGLRIYNDPILRMRT